MKMKSREASARLKLVMSMVLLAGSARAEAPDGGAPPGDGGVAAAPAAVATFLGTPDDAILKRLCAQPIAKLDLNRQGTTIKFKATMADGTRGSLRPAQESDAGYYRADVAAYLLARALGLGTVAPACMRTVTKAELMAAGGAAAAAERLEKELQWAPGGQSIEASVVIWVDKVRSADLEKDMNGWRPLLAQERPLDGAPAALVAHAAEGSRLVAWDFLIANWDRWSGSNTFRVGKDGPFVWLDNAAGFGHYPPGAVRRNEAQLRPVERFSRSMYAALKGAGEAKLTEALAPAGLPARALKQLFARRTALLAHIDALIAKHGERAVLCFD